MFICYEDSEHQRAKGTLQGQRQYLLCVKGSQNYVYDSMILELLRKQIRMHLPLLVYGGQRKQGQVTQED